MGHASIIEALVNGGASVDVQDSDGNTALHKAAMQVRFKGCNTTAMSRA
jgi:ankyrin repeat protein